LKAIQLLGEAVCLYLIIHTLNNKHRGLYGLSKTTVLLTCWAVVAVIFLDPRVMEMLPFKLSESRDIGLMILSNLALFVLVGHLYAQVATLQRALTRLTQNLAIHDYLKSEEHE